MAWAGACRLPVLPTLGPEAVAAGVGGWGAGSMVAVGGLAAEGLSSWQEGVPVTPPPPADQPAAADELCRGALPQPGLRPGPAFHPEQPQVSPASPAPRAPALSGPP